MFVLHKVLLPKQCNFSDPLGVCMRDKDRETDRQKLKKTERKISINANSCNYRKYVKKGRHLCIHSRAALVSFLLMLHVCMYVCWVSFNIF